MANFVIVVDPDADRRSAFVARVTPHLAPVEGLAISECGIDHYRALWACDLRAPVSHTTGDVDAAVIWGEAIPGPGPERLSADQLQTSWNEQGGPSGPQPPATFDGYFAASVYHRQRGLRVGADPLGLFPVYYWHAQDVLLVGSSPELFKMHPLFRARFNAAGLVGILLTGGLFGGETLWKNVRRLHPGHVLVFRPGQAPQELRQYAVQPSSRYFDLPIAGHADVLEAAFDGAIARHVPRDPRPSMFLSGGLDSRMLVGFLRRQRIDPLAITIGERGDLELECATQVACAAKLEHRIARLPVERFVAAAERKTKWEHLANGFSPVDDWMIYPELRQVPSPIVAGYLMGAIFGSQLGRAYVPGSGRLSFESFFSLVTSWGLRPTVLNRLLRREVFQDLVADTAASIRRVYQSYADLDTQRLWVFQLHHKQRFYTGSAAWHLSFGAWPIFPGTDRAILEAMSGMPAAAHDNRRAQVHLVVTRFPELAVLPLDRNSYDTTPLVPRPRVLLRQALRARLAPSRYVPWLRRERRHYYRAFDLNGPGWRAIRRAVEPCRDQVLDLFHPDVLAELIPPPEVLLHAEDPTTGLAGQRVLLGFLLWWKQHGNS